MSTKNPLYKQIDKAIEDGELSPQQIQNYLNRKHISKTKNPQKNTEAHPDNITFKFNLESILTFVGSFILLIGILIVASFNWDLLSNAGKIFITLGSGVFLAIISILIEYITKRTYILNSIQLISGLLISFGTAIFVDVLGPFAIPRPIVAAIMFGFFAIAYGILDLWKKKGVFTFVWLSFFNIAYWCVLGYLFTNQWENLVEYRIPAISAIIMSLIYIGVAGKIWNSSKTFFKAFILNIGAIGAMISTFSLTVKPDYQTGEAFKGSVVGEHLYGLIFVLFYYLAQKTKSKVLLFSTSIGLFVWLMYMINVRYNLSNNLGVSLIIGGLVLIGISFLTVRVGKLFKKKN